MYRTLNLSYTQWKSMRTSFNTLTTFYIEEQFRYILFIVDVTREFVFRTQIFRDDVSNTDLIDFETNIKPSATVETSIDAGIVDEII
jgi:hypothetical protein